MTHVLGFSTRLTDFSLFVTHLGTRAPSGERGVRWVCNVRNTLLMIDGFKRFIKLSLNLSPSYLKTVKGRLQIVHSFPYVSLIILI